MRPWTAAGLIFFAYVGVMLVVMRGIAPRRRLLGAARAAGGTLLCLLVSRLPDGLLLSDWILPPLVLLAAYWASGSLFVAPMPRVETVLRRIDALLAVDRTARAMPRLLAEILEGAYAGVYPLIPIALAIHVLETPEPSVPVFWTVVLVTDFICFGFLPFVQTRPPRAFLIVAPWRSRLRRFNLRLLGVASIKVNTFPSGHAAEALAAALLVTGAPLASVAAVSLAALLVSAGTVYGRYHYAADVLAGWTVALAVWAAFA